MQGQLIATFLVEDVFDIKGRGIVVTGQVQSGEIKRGMKATVFGSVVKVSDIEAFRKTLETAVPGQSVGLLLSDFISKNDFKPPLTLEFSH